jgi:hypothetical protein
MEINLTIVQHIVLIFSLLPLKTYNVGNYGNSINLPLNTLLATAPQGAYFKTFKPF